MMKLLFASDIHGASGFCSQLCKRIEEEEPDKIILLGDLLYHGPRNDLPEGYAPKKVIEQLNKLKDRIIAVRGNCDSEVDQMVLDFPCMGDYTTVLTDDGIELFVTHGHIWSPQALPCLQRPSAFVYGHTHVKQAEIVEGMAVINPGSISLPKDDCRSYAIYESSTFRLKSLAGDLLTQIRVPR